MDYKARIQNLILVETRKQKRMPKSFTLNQRLRGAVKADDTEWLTRAGPKVPEVVAGA